MKKVSEATRTVGGHPVEIWRVGGGPEGNLALGAIWVSEKIGWTTATWFTDGVCDSFNDPDFNLDLTDHSAQDVIQAHWEWRQKKGAQRKMIVARYKHSVLHRRHKRLLQKFGKLKHAYNESRHAVWWQGDRIEGLKKEIESHKTTISRITKDKAKYLERLFGERDKRRELEKTQDNKRVQGNYGSTATSDVVEPEHGKIRTVVEVDADHIVSVTALIERFGYKVTNVTDEDVEITDMRGWSRTVKFGDTLTLYEADKCDLCGSPMMGWSGRCGNPACSNGYSLDKSDWHEDAIALDPDRPLQRSKKVCSTCNGETELRYVSGWGTARVCKSCDRPEQVEDRPWLDELVDWREAPSWADYVTQDGDREIIYHEKGPKLQDDSWDSDGYQMVYRWKKEVPLAHDWEQPLRRPKKVCPLCEGNVLASIRCRACGGAGKINAE